jgi:hypothetical protein
MHGWLEDWIVDAGERLVRSCLGLVLYSVMPTVERSLPLWRVIISYDLFFWYLVRRSSTDKLLWLPMLSLLERYLNRRIMISGCVKLEG